MSQVTDNKGISKIYFEKILFEIIELASLNNNKKIILDYGCGKKQLSKLLNKKILNYDIDPRYNEIDNLEILNYDTVIFNHVLMYLYPKEIEELLDKIEIINPNCELILSLGKQNLLSKIGLILSSLPNAHDNTRSTYDEQTEIFFKKAKLITKKLNVFAMTDIYYFSF